ncbi:MAG: hypothetical protein EOP07_13280 [Proteobacteria bacterium]|nr:MAG: hypothetical protein EOP07_13280 [Pseudomonadota bacterium]
MHFFERASLPKDGQDISGLLKKELQLEIEVEKSLNSNEIDLWNLKRKIIGPDFQDVLQNWTEQEADEVGYEIYIRAGFKDSIYSEDSFDFPNSDSDGTLREACLISLNEAKKGRLVSILRGGDAHPSECWRRYDISILENKKHFKDYSDLWKSAIQTTIFPGELDAVKRTLKTKG